MKLSQKENLQHNAELYETFLELLMDRKPQLDRNLAGELAGKFTELTDICEQENGEGERLKEEIKTCIQCARDVEYSHTRPNRPELKLVWKSSR